MYGAFLLQCLMGCVDTSRDCRMSCHTFSFNTLWPWPGPLTLIEKVYQRQISYKSVVKDLPSLVCGHIVWMHSVMYLYQFSLTFTNKVQIIQWDFTFNLSLLFLIVMISHCTTLPIETGAVRWAMQCHHALLSGVLSIIKHFGINSDIRL